jgi:hypothetical protein
MGVSGEDVYDAVVGERAERGEDGALLYMWKERAQ